MIFQRAAAKEIRKYARIRKKQMTPLLGLTPSQIPSEELKITTFLFLSPLSIFLFERSALDFTN